jgi:hypothetical protein
MAITIVDILMALFIAITLIIGFCTCCIYFGVNEQI